jgi:carboxymethylenebutenolidase
MISADPIPVGGDFVWIHPGQSHAFSRHNGKHYKATAADLANGRTSEFLNRQLR